MMSEATRSHMTDTETKLPQSNAERRPRWPPWMEPILADWRKRWPAAFTNPVPLAIGISGHMKAVLRAEDKVLDRKTFSVTIHFWTKQGAYLHAVMRGEMRRNLDGSEAGVPNDEARQHAKKILDDRLARRRAAESSTQRKPS